MGSGTSMMVVGMMADASDGPDSSLSLGLAHDVFPLPLHYALCQLCATPPTFFDKSGPFEPCHEHSSDCDSDPKPGPGTGRDGGGGAATGINYFNFPTFALPYRARTMKASRCEECLLQPLCRFCIYCYLLGKMMLTLHCSLHPFPNWSNQ